ncbi:MAG: triose-phosphate isomerase [Armatimonadetes bacterium]|nr:triose-phosphate isomerase [Armatimonadota bacterium]
MRTPMMAGNWKMNCDLDEAAALAQGVVEGVGSVEGVAVVLAPPFTALDRVASVIAGSNVRLSAQNVYWQAKGAYTGEISVGMLKSCGCAYVIVGHSERRGRFGVPEPDMTDELIRVFGDTDAAVNTKARAALAGGLTPIICVGETLAEREAGLTDAIVRDQVVAALEGMTPEQIGAVVLAYEPVWAIGTGETCEADEANRVIGVIRAAIDSVAGAGAAQDITVLYGGSVKPKSVRELVSQPEIDGGLVGGASLEADSFNELVAVTREVRG